MPEKTDLVAGKCVRVWRYYCAGCATYLDVEDVGHNLTSERAAMFARKQAGWSKTHTGWKCSRCKSKKATP